MFLTFSHFIYDGIHSGALNKHDLGLEFQGICFSPYAIQVNA